MFLNTNASQKSKQVRIINLEFFICCIVLGLECLHVNNIIHRDIKPENLVLDEKGYVRITDFGIAKFYQKENSSETSGTPGYMSPEVMCGQNHTIAVDYFALGVIAYEFMMGVVCFINVASVFGKK
jgi:serine/threonine protein kinase